MNRMNKMILICTAVLAAVFLAGFDRELSAAAAPPQRKKVSDNKVEVYPVKTVLRELFSVDPEKRIGVYGRYTELTAEDDVPEALSRIIAEVNARVFLRKTGIGREKQAPARRTISATIMFPVS